MTGHYDSVARRTEGQGGGSASTGRAPTTTLPVRTTMGRARPWCWRRRGRSREARSSSTQRSFRRLAGEEQGLVGATLHAARAAREGRRIEAVLNNDIVGGSRGGAGVSDAGQVRVFSEAPRIPCAAGARYVRRQAALISPVRSDADRARRSLRSWRRSHAFNQQGWPPSYNEGPRELLAAAHRGRHPRRR